MTPQTTQNRGSAGLRLSADLRASIPDDLLREFAQEILGAKRMSASYHDTLRVVLGNQALAEQRSQTLEMNIRGEAGTERTMRTIINQMKDASITQGKHVSLGQGRIQVVQCYIPPPSPRMSLTDYLRAEEARLEAGRQFAVLPSPVPDVIALGDVPF